MLQHCSQAQAFEWLEQGATLVTSNQRRQQYLTEAYSRMQLAQQRQVWPSPCIVPWTLWWQAFQTELALVQALLPPKVLSHFEAGLCWQQILAAEDQLLRPSEAAKLAQQAWNWARQYRLQVEPLESTEEYQQLCRWAQLYREQLQALAVMDEVDWFDSLLEPLAAGLGSLPPRLVFSGFDEVTPQQQELLTALSERGVELYLLQAPPQVKDCYLLPVQDSHAELRAAVDWAAARHQLKQQVALIVPDLATHRAELVRLLNDRFHPEWRLQPTADRVPGYNLSLGTPLCDEPLVQSILRVLKLASSYRLDMAELEAWLYSPFWAAGDEYDWAAWLVRMRADCPRHLSRSQLLSYLDEALPAALFDLLHQPFPAKASASDWASQFAQFLQASIRRSALNSREYQAWQQFSEQLSALGRLDPLMPSLSLHQARQYLFELCQDCLFQTETLGQPWLQVLGPLEALGGQFDAVWMLGMSQDAWPTSIRPQPFLPLLSQQRHRLPHASAEREREHCQWLLQQIQAISPELYFSYPQSQQDRQLAPSRILPDCQSLPSPDLMPDLLRQQRQQALSWQALDDAKAPDWRDDEQAWQLLSALKWQAVCPLAGFVYGRLHARAYPQWHDELDPRQLGILTHAINQRLWQQLQTQSALLALSEPERALTLAQCIEQQISRFDAQQPGWLSLSNRQWLSQTLQQSLLVVLQQEAERPQPFKVLAQERAFSGELAGLKFQLRLDRLDELADGKKLIIDYKTSAKAHFKQWLPPKNQDFAEFDAKVRQDLMALSKASRAATGLTEPQLPAYALMLLPDPSQLAGLAFARVGAKADSQGFSVLDAAQAFEQRAERCELAAQAVSSLYQYWHQQLEHWALSYRQGQAALKILDRKALNWVLQDVGPVLRLDPILQQQWPLTGDHQSLAQSAHLLKPKLPTTGHSDAE